MKNSLSEKDKEFYKRVDEVLYYVWDPIGVSDSPEARDEYCSYVSKVFSLLSQNADSERIEEHLIDIEKYTMGLISSKKRVKADVKLLLQWKDRIYNQT
ncbi:MAG TPA: hypothetical protein ENN97_07530 [Phycisphaerales bacterium]|nr:hypothetical protein [Phycisphaerales bacterium]